MLKGVIKVCHRGARQSMYLKSLNCTEEVMKSLKSALFDPQKYAEEEAAKKAAKEKEKAMAHAMAEGTPGRLFAAVSRAKLFVGPSLNKTESNSSGKLTSVRMVLATIRRTISRNATQ